MVPYRQDVGAGQLEVDMMAPFEFLFQVINLRWFNNLDLISETLT